MVASYKDIRGNVHELTITIATRNRLKDQLEIDLAGLWVYPEKLEQFLTTVLETEKLWKVLGVLEGVPADDLMNAANGDTEEQAGMALLQALTDFFPQSHPVTKGMKTLLDRVRKANHIHQEAAGKLLAGLATSLDLSTVFSSADPSTNGSGELQAPSGSQTSAA